MEVKDNISLEEKYASKFAKNNTPLRESIDVLDVIGRDLDEYNISDKIVTTKQPLKESLGENKSPAIDYIYAQKMADVMKAKKMPDDQIKSILIDSGVPEDKIAGILGAKDESLNEKFSDSFPDWFKDRLGKESNYGTVASSLNAKNIDLNKASFVEKSVPQNIKDIHAITDNELPVFLLKDEWSEHLYIPGLNSNDYDVVYNVPDPSHPGFTKDIYARPSRVPYKYLLPMIEKFGYIDLEAPHTYSDAIRKERTDAKAGSLERGRGQFQHHDILGYEKKADGRDNYDKPILDPKVQWLDTKGQDKSGYLIKPDAIKDRLLKMHAENPAYLLDKIYNRLVAARDRISKYFNSYDIKKGGDPRSGIIGSKLDDAVEYFTRASDKYRTIVKNIEDINNSNDPDDKKKQQAEWLFDPETSWSGGYIDLRDYVDSLEAALDKLETSKPNQYDEDWDEEERPDTIELGVDEAPVEDDKIVPDDQDDEDDVPMTPKDYKMVYGDSYGGKAGQEVQEGDTLTDFRGDKAIYCTFTDSRHDGTQVTVVNTPEEFKQWEDGDWQAARNYYWTVYDLKLQKR